MTSLWNLVCSQHMISELIRFWFGFLRELGIGNIGFEIRDGLGTQGKAWNWVYDQNKASGFSPMIICIFIARIAECENSLFLFEIELGLVCHGDFVIVIQDWWIESYWFVPVLNASYLNFYLYAQCCFSSPLIPFSLKLHQLEYVKIILEIMRNEGSKEMWKYKWTIVGAAYLSGWYYSKLSVSSWNRIRVRTLWMSWYTILAGGLVYPGFTANRWSEGPAMVRFLVIKKKNHSSVKNFCD